MRIFVYEYTCSQVWPEPASVSLRAEGEAMLRAVAEDFGCINGVEVLSLAARAWRSPEEEKECFAALARRADYSFIIAPEFDDLLLTRHHWVQEAGGHWLGCEAEAIRLTADKLLLGEHLRLRGVPSPACRLLPGGPPS